MKMTHNKAVRNVENYVFNLVAIGMMLLSLSLFFMSRTDRARKREKRLATQTSVSSILFLRRVVPECLVKSLNQLCRFPFPILPFQHLRHANVLSKPEIDFRTELQWYRVIVTFIPIPISFFLQLVENVGFRWCVFGGDGDKGECNENEMNGRNRCFVRRPNMCSGSQAVSLPVNSI